MPASAPIDLSRLPAPAVTDVLDVESYVAALKADLVLLDPTLADVLALESEPIVKLVEAYAYRELLLRNHLNASARACLLAYAEGPDLDNLAVNLAVVREDGEGDSAFRARALLAPDGWSTAGPVKAYAFHALSAHPAITDVDPTSPAPGVVRVAVLTIAGEADDAVLQAVTAALNADEVRPLTDQVQVVSAQTDAFDVVAQLIVGSGPDSATVEAGAVAAVQAYADSVRRIGRKVARNALIGALMQPGVTDCVLSSPAADIPGAAGVAPLLGTLDITVVVDGDA